MHCYILLQIGLLQFALYNSLSLNTYCSSKHLAPQHTLLQRTCYSSAHFAPQHTLLQRTFYSSEQFTPQHTLLQRTFYLDIRLFFWSFRLLPSLDICLHLAFSRGGRSTMICKTGNIIVSVDFYKL